MKNADGRVLPYHRGVLAVLFASILYGTSGAVLSLAPAGATPGTVAAARLIIGGCSLFFLSLVFSRKTSTPGKTAWIGALGAAFCMAAMQLFFFKAIALIGVALGTIIFIGSYPVFAGLIELLIKRRQPGGRWLVATAMAIGACYLLLGRGTGGHEVNGAGVLYSLGAGIAYALFSTLIKSLLRGYSTLGLLAVVTCFGAAFLSPMLLSADLYWLTKPSGIGVALYLGVVTTATPYWLLAHGLRSIPVSTAATLNLAEPFAAGLLGVFALGERLGPMALVGMLLLSCSLLIMTVRR